MRKFVGQLPVSYAGHGRLMGMSFDIGLLVCLLVGCANAQTGSFSLVERFGVAHPDQPVEFAYQRGPVGNLARLVGPDLQEVPFQQLSNGNILIRTGLPASRMVTTYKASLNGLTDTVTLSVLQQAQPGAGDVIRFGNPAPGGLAAGVDYYLKATKEYWQYQLSTRKDLSDTVNFTASGDFTVQRPGWIFDSSNGSYYARAHGYKTADPVLVVSTGVLPAPLVAGTAYYVVRVGADNFRLSATRADAVAGKPIVVQNTGSGLMGTEVRWTWTLIAGARKAAVVSPVRMTAVGGTQEITNGLTGVRVVTAAGNPQPFQRAPIQGVQMANGTWLATGPNLLYDAYTQRPAGIVTSYGLRVVESGPLLTRVEASYALNRPEYNYGGAWSITGVDIEKDEIRVAGNPYSWGTRTSLSFRANGGGLPCGVAEKRLYWPLTRTYDRTANETILTLTTSPGGARVNVSCAASGRPAMVETMNIAGAGSFRETISLYAGQKSVVVESDTDAQLQYFLNFYQAGQFEPNQARYRGHAASNQACGYSLQAGAKVNYVPYTDATVDLPATGGAAYICSAATIKFAPIWYLAASGRDTGWYWQMYSASGGASSPMVGYYLGRPSRLLAALQAGPGVYTDTKHFAGGAGRAAGITFFASFRGPDGRTAQRTRREWMIYAGTKGEMRDPLEVQPIARERNALASINLTRLAAYQLEYGDPAGGWPAPFTDRKSYQQMVNRVKTDSAYRNNLFNSVPELRDLIPLWQDNTPAAAELVVAGLEQFVSHWQQILVNQDGPFDSWWQYYQPGIAWQPLASRVLAVLNSDAATPGQKARTKATAAFVASVLWDNDYVPWDTDTSESVGNVNQGLQYSMYRAQSSLALAGAHPLLSPWRDVSRQYVESALDYLHPESGAPRGSTHYHAAAMDPALANFLLMKANGVDINQYPVWKSYGQWMLDALTPPEPRFGGMRKMVSSGDGNTAGSAMPGMVATLWRGIDDTLSSALQWGWVSQNSATTKTLGQFSAPAALVIDELAPAMPPALKSADYAGYWSVLRHGFGTPNETVAWFTNGDFYNDHRHIDTGQVSIYAHAAPLAIDWNANLYYPQAAGALQHNRVVYEDEIGLRWNADSLPLGAGGNAFRAATATAFVGQELATDARSVFVGTDGTEWRRGVTMVAADAQYPVLLVRDQFAGPKSAAAKVLTWNLMAQGMVDAPGGSYPPVERLNTGQAVAPNALPSSGLVLGLGAGPQRFGFRGQTWAAHPTQGIDWDLYLVPDGSQSFYVGNWGHSAHTSREMAEYQKANGQPFREQQHILRVRGTGAFTTLILPYRKGETPAQRTVTQESCGLQIAQAGGRLCVGESGYQYNGKSRQAVASFGTAAVSGLGVTVAGGPVEVVMTSNTVRLNVSGRAGQRVVTLPGTWGEVAGWTRAGSVYRMSYAGGRMASAEGRK